MTTLVPPERRDEDELQALRGRVVALEAELGERDAEVVKAKTELDAFRIKYRQQVGTLHEELDKIEFEIAEIELGELNKRLEGADGAPSEAAAARPDMQPRLTSDAVRKLFRDVAKAIHPDLARDAEARDRRHALMVQANRAYALGDEEQLRLILQAWERSPEAVQGSDPEAMRLRLERRIAQVEEEMVALAEELVALRDQPLWKLKVMVDEAAAKRKDLVSDMVRRLKRDIMAASNRLDALRAAQ